MKFNYPLVVFDLETTDREDARCIIEVGAVVLTPQLHRVIGRFQALVRPRLPDAVSDYVVDLTGHTREDLAAADPFPAVAERFHDWCLKKSGVNRLAKLRLAAWGNYFDVNVLRAEYAAWGLPYPFSGTAIDVKTAALLWCAASGRRTDALSVHKCAEAMNIVPLGPYHRADVDADATAQIFQRAVGDLAGGVWVGRQYVAVRPEGP